MATYTIGLDSGEIDKLIKELESRTIDSKIERFREAVANRIAELARSGFASAVEDVVKGTSKGFDVDVSIQNNGNMTLVIASGKDVMFIEFGAGVYHNGSAGSSPHPMGSTLGMTIGSFGKGKGKRKIWAYRDNGELILTRGTKATMPMYNAVNTISSEIESIARGIFT